MKGEIRIESPHFQAFGYPTVAILVRNPNIYYPWVIYSSDTNDTTDILDDILRRYSGAWEKLADI